MSPQRTLTGSMHVFFAAIGVFGICCISANIVKPEPLETMDCVSPDFKELICTWNKSNPHSAPTKWEIWYSWRPVNGFKYSKQVRCPAESQTNFSMTCRWASCRDPLCKEGFAPMREYRVYVAGSSQLGNVTKTFDITPEHHVKLTVEKLQLRTTATSLAVKWNLDEDIFLSIFNSTLDFETLTSLDNLTTDPKVSKWTINSKGETEFTKEIPGLYPFTRYKFCVKAKLSGNRGFWSEPICDKVITKETAPIHAPETDRWAFYVDGDQIQLYMKEVPLHLRTSKEYRYSIQGLEGGNITTSAVTPGNTTITIPASRISEQGPLLIRSCNDMGCSSASTPINTDKIRTEFRPRGVIVTKKTDSYTVSCDIPEKFRKEIQLTKFYYCRGHRENNICLSNFNWMTKTGAESNLTIIVPDVKYGDWMFGVSIVANDNTSGGILFADCYSSSNNSCKYGNILKVEHASDKILITILVVLPSVILILIAFFILRYLKQRYCEEIKIELPVLFQMKNSQREMTYESQNVVEPYNSIPTTNIEHQEATETKTVNNGDKRKISVAGSSESSSCDTGVVDNSFDNFKYDTVQNYGLDEEKQYFLNVETSTSSSVSSKANSKEFDKNNDDVFDRNCSVSYKASLISLNENYVTNEDCMENKQDLKEKAQYFLDVLPSEYARCVVSDDLPGYYTQSDEVVSLNENYVTNEDLIQQDSKGDARHSLDVLPSEYARCVVSDDLFIYRTQSEESISFAEESRMCSSNKINNGGLKNSTLNFKTKSFSDSFINPEHVPFLIRSSVEFKETVTMHPDYVH
uniref:Fibronectin type-III domain-containing protein n=1 Tax=Magallana gigas TaxID=29159 RepID=A0A8W8IIF6_MAGGI